MSGVLKEKLIASINRLPERHVDYLTLLELPFFVYGCAIYGAPYPVWTTELLILAFAGVGMVRAIRFPGFWDAFCNLLFGWLVSLTVGGLVQTLHPHLGGPTSWLRLGFIGGFALSAPAFVLAVIRISDGPAFSSSTLKRRLRRLLALVRRSRR